VAQRSLGLAHPSRGSGARQHGPAGGPGRRSAGAAAAAELAGRRDRVAAVVVLAAVGHAGDGHVAGQACDDVAGELADGRGASPGITVANGDCARRQGNEVYAAEFPSLEIIASERTKENLTRPDAGVGGVPYIDKQLTALPKEIEQFKDEILKASSPEQKARLEANLQQAEAYLAELKNLKPTLPTRTVATTATLNEQGREIQLLLLGRGHTDGDVYVYLPKEKVVVTGDAVIEWMPFLNDGYPEEWVQTLSALETVDFTHMILGHGEVVSKEHLTFFKGYLTDLIASVRKAAADGGTLEEMQKMIPDQLAPRYESRMSKYPLGQYRDRIGVNIETVYKKVVQKG
jgi:glyoxylase-like metal-dependent hydrolase (beta-lactamase superfamily II)